MGAGVTIGTGSQHQDVGMVAMVLLRPELEELTVRARRVRMLAGQEVVVQALVVPTKRWRWCY